MRDPFRFLSKKTNFSTRASRSECLDRVRNVQIAFGMFRSRSEFLDQSLGSILNLSFLEFGM